MSAARAFPSRWSWRRWRATRRLASFLYTSGITRSGGRSTMDGSDPVGGWIYHLPRWRDALPKRGRMRPYLLFLPDWWWQCHIAQGWRLRGRHKPEEPYVFGICAACLPCPDCGARYECRATCPTTNEAAGSGKPTAS